MVLHMNLKENKNNTQNYPKQKCNVCNFGNFDGKQITVHEVENQKFKLCMKCDKIIEFKEVLVTDNFDMKVFLNVKRPKSSLKEFDQMVNPWEFFFP